MADFNKPGSRVMKVDSGPSPDDFVSVGEARCTRCDFNDHGERCWNPGTYSGFGVPSGWYCGPHRRFFMGESSRERMFSELKDYRQGMNHPAATYADEFHRNRLAGKVETKQTKPVVLPYEKGSRVA